MRVLLAARHPPNGRKAIGGVQSWVATVAAEMHRLRLRVECWGPEMPVPAGRFDLGIFANAGDTKRVMTICNRALTISHGIIAPERPLDDVACAFTSEEVRDHWKGDGAVIRQPIDLEFWLSGATGEPPAVVRYGYYGGLEFLPECAARLGFPFRHVLDATHEQAREVLRSAVVVLASGRSALEAAACGAPVVICDDRPYQGPLLAPFGTEQMTRNYSGRGGVEPSVDNVTTAIRGAIEIGNQRAHVEEHHDACKVVAQLLCLPS